MRVAIACFGAAMMVAPVALAQGDPRPAAHARVNAILNGNVEGADTPFGYISDLFRYSASGSGCQTHVVRTQRAVYRRKSVLRGQVVDQTIPWGGVREVRIARIPYRNISHPAVLLVAGNGAQVVYAVPSERVMHELRDAMLTLKTACDPQHQRLASQPMPAPKPRPAPAPTPIARPVAGFQWQDRKTEQCSSYAVQGLSLFPGYHATLHRAARGSDTENRLVLSQPLQGSGGQQLASTPPNGPMENLFIVRSPTGAGQARSVTLAFDGRPSGVVPDMPDARDVTSNTRDILLPADFADRLANVSTITLTLKAPNGTVMSSLVFDVADIRLMRRELVNANWSCRNAR